MLEFQFVGLQPVLTLKIRGGVYLFVERLATANDLQENHYLEEVGDTLWATAVEIRCCPYCGVELTDARSAMSSDDFGYFIHLDSSGWLSRRC